MKWNSIASDIWCINMMWLCVNMHLASLKIVSVFLHEFGIIENWKLTSVKLYNDFHEGVLA